MRKCILCGKEYEYCPSCPKDKDKALWHKLYHSENCRNIFNTLNDFNFNLIDKTQAQERLSACDLSVELNDHYRNEINAIMEKPKPKRGMRAKAQIFDDVAAPVLEEIINEAPVPSEE